ncbi:phage portal protein [Peptostreptococcus faecalis]|uniref:phage portal protein n=1 Tax=Peptostreptococcus faecalis TaxID=2045015 RepID=UPI000C7C4C0A|nr:phage portal protein [Peptostreptococcus faecalis]
MELKELIERIKKYRSKIDKFATGKKYYLNKSDVLDKGVNGDTVTKIKDDILRNADNRIAHNFHQILVDEKASYLFSDEPTIDINDNRENNESIREYVENQLSRMLKSLCIEASNCGLAWLHYWVNDNGLFRYAKVNAEEIVPIYNDGLGLDRKLEGVIRYYQREDKEDNEEKKVYFIEYWTDTEMVKYKLKELEDNTDIETIKITHTFGKVPFIKFANNEFETSDLDKYKSLVDLYDRVMSGFANDLEDVQQILYILENYGGEDLDEFKDNLKRYKVLNLDTDPQTGKGDFKTMQIEIPVEARKVILEELKKQIYESGQGLQQDSEKVGNASGVALKFFYRKLDLKAGLLETEFIPSIEELIEQICKYKGIAISKIQIYIHRNRISNDLELAQIAQQSVGIVPMKMILTHHPFVEDVEEAIKLLEEEKKKDIQTQAEIDYEKQLGGGVVEE